MYIFDKQLFSNAAVYNGGAVYLDRSENTVFLGLFDWNSVPSTNHGGAIYEDTDSTGTDTNSATFGINSPDDFYKE